MALICGWPLQEPSKKGAVTPAEQPADTPDDLPQELVELLPKLPPEDQETVIRLVSVSAVVGPLPPPEMLDRYDSETKALICSHADAQIRHRHELEYRQVQGNERRMDRGQLIAAGVSLTALGLGAAVMIVGGMTTAAVVGGAVFVTIGIGGPSVATVFAEVLARKIDKTAEQEERPQPQQRKRPAKKGGR